jgi:antagonist of KipI
MAGVIPLCSREGAFMSAGLFDARGLFSRLSSMAAIASALPDPVGDAAVAMLVTGSSAAETLGRVRGLADAIQAASLPGVTDVVASPGRVTVAYDPLAIADAEGLRRAVAAAAAASDTGGGESIVHEIPVVYDGPDLDEVCAGHGIDRAELITAHTAPDYLVEAIGFLPGFGYLAGLPADLATPRRATPRRLVPAGSVGIGGGQTGVYPFASPGGWNLVGRSRVTLFDVRRPRPALLAVGDRVRFVAADLPPAAEPEPEAAAGAARDATITVVQPGLSTTIQDLGRPGLRAAGVPLSGAADPVSLRLANLLVGNPEAAAAIECTLLGPTLRFEQEAVVALVGGTFPGFPGNAATRLPAGTQLALGHATAGCRGYIAVAGGIDVEPVLGSRSTLMIAGFGGLAGRPLRAGDRLAVPAGAALDRRGPSASGKRDVARLRRLAGSPPAVAAGRGPAEQGKRLLDRHAVLRIMPGEHAEAFGGRAWSRSFRASSRSDRMGVRLDGEPLPGAAGGGALASVAVFPGTVQVPPDGLPIVLLADAQTIGGYPVLGQVLAADLPRAAQLRPGDEVRFEPVSLAEAHAALREREAWIATIREAVR